MLTQSQYRFGRDELTESTHSWLAGINRGVYRVPGTAGDCLLRVGVQADAAGASGLALQWQYRLTTVDANGDPVVGSWAAVPADTSGPVRVVGSPTFVDGASCTQRLSGTGTFTVLNSGCTETGTVASQEVVASGCTESEIPLRTINLNTTFGDLIELRVTSAGTPLDSYADLPSLRVAKVVLAEGSYSSGDAITSSTSVKKIRGAILSYFGRLSDLGVAAPTFSIQMNVFGTTDPLSEVYNVPIYGPDTWVGGLTGKDGLPIYPQMSFAGSAPSGVKKVRAVFNLSRPATLSIDAGLAEGFASGRSG